MAYTGRQFDSLPELVDYLNDIVLSKALGEKVLGLHGKTFIVNDGGGDRVATFSDPNGAGLTPNQIRDQIYAAHASLQTVEMRNYRSSVPPTPRVAIVTPTHIVRSIGTANTLLGFSTTTDVTVGANAVAKADIVSIDSDEGGNKFSLVHE